ncbi:FadR family transcriptional regulator [Mesorhizobium sp. CA13]|uniref:FadR/GntR family transcriptional regulator n=1 Tax=unclassified Mesorhizobium TaxID=325217 RepID=UPI001CCB0BF4|nr:MULTISPECIES: FadR/GntR family transcriptional regulator [unclassified Mesorhizobium]MBZ9856501.1 FadR family transcriptional regulator [Mesorhizobium sp. CA13]MBZ9965752.1 FadR family transcriptional regulator [Mesorhizobium sp. BR1-1-2]MCA0011869.1 FadR family transcriptional regulator [Mesorhizobium sp. B294B1A1]MCA0038123.1 FadR family transcriptional regulator [Mesorhizobium sp. B292B1B]
MMKLNLNDDGKTAASQPPDLRRERREPSGGVAQATVAALQSMIRDGRLQPGDTLPPQRDLARDLNVSRATLREALSILATIGEIVAREGGRGFVCADPSGAPATPSWRFAARYSLSEVFQFRYIVESYAAELAALTHTDQEIADLKGCTTAFRNAAREKDLNAYAQADFDFHNLIMRISRNKLLVDMHQTFASVLLESQRLPTERRGNLLFAVQEHDRILEAVAMGDPDGANYYMRKHISMAGSRAGLPPSQLP